MSINVIHSVLNALNSSEAHIGYTSWFASPSFPAMLLFFSAALVATIHLMPLGKKYCSKAASERLFLPEPATQPDLP
ncbi:hypothetical protein [Leclercia adecarboxylata]|uniref:hypothetical protein n=1 Tax=Leclercia adecarboxylata TaxID=83655 RepID=UPI0012E0C36A|nr:hypothetical protein [Leclercia adecarboxylata]